MQKFLDTRKKDINSVGEFDLLKNYGHSGPQRTRFITKLYKQANRSALLCFHLRRFHLRSFHV